MELKKSKYPNLFLYLQLNNRLSCLPTPSNEPVLHLNFLKIVCQKQKHQKNCYAYIDRDLEVAAGHGGEAQVVVEHPCTLRAD